MRNALRILLGIIISVLSVFAAAVDDDRINEENLVFFHNQFKTYAKCIATEKVLSVDLRHQPLYHLRDGQCVKANLKKEDKVELYPDNTCQGSTVFYKVTGYDEFCNETGAPYHDRMGNAARWLGDRPSWTLYPSGALSLSVLPVNDNYQPFMQRVRYKSVAVRDRFEADDGNVEVVTLRGTGRCDLGMRIYKKDIAATGLKPMMALHGGGWALRGTPFTGFESELSHFTERGFVVFAPFYRLSAYKDGNYECNHADWHEIVSDAEDALAWVVKHGEEYGADMNGNGDKVYLMGGSAGGHLAAWLTVHKREHVARSLLFYPPTDIRDFIRMALESDDRLDGEGVLEEFLDVPSVDDVDLDSEAVVENSFPQMVVAAPDDFPPVNIIHGVSDTLVPSLQSVRLCNAYNGDLDNGPAKNDGGDPANGTYSREYACGANGRLFLIAEGRHSLDACVAHLGCPAGSEQSQKAVQRSIEKALDWFAQ
jgi:acetyl esterase/lipase